MHSQHSVTASILGPSWVDCMAIVLILRVIATQADVAYLSFGSPTVGRNSRQLSPVLIRHPSVIVHGALHLHIRHYSIAASIYQSA